MDPFEAPGADDVAPEGRIDAMLAVRTGLSALLAHWVQALGVTFVAFSLYIVSICSCVLWIAVLPWLYWGGNLWVLAALDGRGDVGVLWTSVQEAPGTAFKRTWGYLAIIMLAMSPIMIANFAIQLYTAGMTPEQMTMFSVAMQLPFLILSLFLVRLTIGYWYIVERRATVIDALSRGWRETADSWGALASIVVVWFLIQLGPQIGVAYVNAWFQSKPIGSQLDAMPVLYAALFGFSMITTVLGLVYFFVLGAAYRQLYPQPPEELV